ncbi:MAG: SH3 domain-containing protein, partial [Pseudomonadota bacterium]|nr:SH3 domain-containing protein [Pseudomonadota bacterium]
MASEIAWAQSADVQRAIDAYNEGDYAAAMAVWEPLANQGNRDAQFAMGVLYYEGHGVNKNLDEALAWFRKAADSEHPTAMFNLGVAYWEGRGLSQNYAQAVDWWERAAESGDVASQYNLGLAYYLGKGAQKDVDQARNWLTQAAEKGHADAQHVLGIIDEKYTKSQTASSATSDTSTASATNQAGSAEVESVTVQPAEQHEAQAQSASEPSSGQVSNATTPEVPTKVTTTTNEEAAASSVLITTRFRAAEVSVDGLELRSGPSSQSPVLQTLRQGTPVKIIEARGSWGRVEIPGQVRLWVFGDYVQGTPEGRITANKVRLRNRPTTGENSKVVAHLNKGDSVTVHTSTGDWKQISSRKATPAWVRLSGVSEQNPVTQDWLDNFNALAKAPTVRTKTASASSTPSAFRAAWVRGDNTAVFGRA